MLENEVDEKYFLSDKALLGKINSNFGSNNINSIMPKDGIAPTLMARDYKDPKLVQVGNLDIKGNDSLNMTAVLNNLRIRKLTPKEYWRLMGFSDELFEKAQQVNSNAQLYKQAGNSIVVTVLMAIFGELLDINWQDKVKELLNKIIQ